MDNLIDLTIQMLQEGTVRGIIVTLLSTVLLVLGKKTWTWLRTPTPLSPLVTNLCEYLIHHDRLKDSKVSGDGTAIETPKIDSQPHYKILDVDGVGDVWDVLTRAEKKAVKKAHKKCATVLIERNEAKEAADLETLRKEAEKALLPFVKRG